MISVTFNRRLHLLPNSPAKDERQVETGIRDLLRDTALLVTSLTSGGESKSINELQTRCRELIRGFSAALRSRGYAEDICEEAGIAQCGLLDEVALRHFEGNERATWELSPLQVEHFGIHDAGERVFERLEQRLRESVAQVDLLEYYSAVLGLGFVGRYVRDGDAKLDDIIAALNTRISKLRPATALAFTSERKGRRPSDWLYRLSPWAIAGLLAIVAALTWLAWHAALDVQLSHLLPGKPQP
jgi:type VI secretion system protein ImpK